MFEAAAFAYSLMATFILCSAERNRRTQRAHARVLIGFGTVIMSMSFALSAMLFCVAAWKALF